MKIITTFLIYKDFRDNRCTSQILDEDTGLYYYGARYYDPELGRFIQADPIVLGTLNSSAFSETSPLSGQAFNRYSYVVNNPLKFVDPTGNFGWPGPHNGDPIASHFPPGWTPPVPSAGASSGLGAGMLAVAVVGGPVCVVTVAPVVIGTSALSSTASGTNEYSGNIPVADIVVPDVVDKPLWDFPDLSWLEEETIASSDFYSPMFPELLSMDYVIPEYSPKVHYFGTQITASMIASIGYQSGWAWDNNTGEFGMYWTFSGLAGSPAISPGFVKGTLYDAWISDEIGGASTFVGGSWTLIGGDVGITDSNLLFTEIGPSVPITLMPPWLPEAHGHKAYTIALPIGNYKKIRKDIIKAKKFIMEANKNLGPVWNPYPWNSYPRNSKP